MNGFEGLDRMIRTLDELKDKTSKRAAKAGVNAGLGVLAKAMRTAINSSAASPELKRAARQAINKRLCRKEGQSSVGKAGFAVGKQSKAKKTAATKRSNDKSRRGVGISGSNIHWPTLGTQDRHTTGGHDTGKMPPILEGVINTAASSSSAAVLEAMRKKTQQVLASDAARAKKG